MTGSPRATWCPTTTNTTTPTAKTAPTAIATTDPGNCGEGATDDSKITELPECQKRNFLATLLSHGVLVIARGDELGRTRDGNDNVYRQANDISWIDWDSAREHDVLTEFTARVTGLRAEHPIVRRHRFFQGRPIRDSSIDDIAWLRPDDQQMSGEDWNIGYVRTVGVLRNGDGIPDRNTVGQHVVDDSFLLLFNETPPIRHLHHAR